jgi:class 3 adenylate cyclase
MEYIIYGDVLKQISEGMRYSQKNDTVVSKQAWDHLEQWHKQDLVVATECRDNSMKVTWLDVDTETLPLPVECKYRKHKLSQKDVLLLARYVPSAVYHAIVNGYPTWLDGEMRQASAMFVHITGIAVADVTNDILSRVMMLAQSCCDLNEGVVNKLLVDDKGLLVVIVFGLPPMPHDDDAARAVATAALMCKAVDDWELEGPNGKVVRARVGIASGSVYCGVTGEEECESTVDRGKKVEASTLEVKAGKKVAAEKLAVAELRQEVAKLRAEMDNTGDSDHLTPTGAGNLRAKIGKLAGLQARLKKEEKQLEHAEAVAEKAHRASGGVSGGTGGSRARQEYTVLGANVNLAARLMSRARPGQICVCERTEAAVPDRFSFKRQQPVVLKGINDGREVTTFVFQAIHGSATATNEKTSCADTVDGKDCKVMAHNAVANASHRERLTLLPNRSLLQDAAGMPHTEDETRDLTRSCRERKAAKLRVHELERKQHERTRRIAEFRHDKDLSEQVYSMLADELIGEVAKENMKRHHSALHFPHVHTPHIHAPHLHAPHFHTLHLKKTHFRGTCPLERRLWENGDPAKQAAAQLSTHHHHHPKIDAKIATEKAKVAELQQEVGSLQAEVVAAGDSNHLAPTEAGELRVKVHTLEKLQARLKKEEKQLKHAEAVAEKVATKDAKQDAKKDMNATKNQEKFE